MVVVGRLQLDAELRVGALEVVDASLLRPCILQQARDLLLLRCHVEPQVRKLAVVDRAHAARRQQPTASRTRQRAWRTLSGSVADAPAPVMHRGLRGLVCGCCAGVSRPRPVVARLPGFEIYDTPT